MTVCPIPYELRSYEPADEEQVVELLATCLPGWRRPRAHELFRWKHEHNPFGPSRRVVATVDGEVVGFFARMRWRLARGRRVVEACRSTDGAVRPDMQRHGIGQAFGRIDIEEVHARRDPPIHFAHGNQLTEKVKRRLGHPVPSEFEVELAPLRPWRLARWKLRGRGSGSSPGGLIPITDLLGHPGLDDLLARARPTDRWVTERSERYLRWRYEDLPDRDHCAVVSSTGGRLRGALIGRAVPEPSTAGPGFFEVSELIVPGEDRAVLRHLLRRTWAADCAYAIAMLPPYAHRVDALATGFVSRRGRPWTFRALGLADDLPDDLSDRRSWDLPLGDLATL